MKGNGISQYNFVLWFSLPFLLHTQKTSIFFFPSVLRQGHSEFIGINCVSLKLSFRILSSAGVHQLFVSESLCRYLMVFMRCS